MPRQFVLVMTDTQPLDMVSCYEDVGIKTPCIDALCEEGIRFNNAYTAQPVCGPARSALFTGQFPCINGVYTNSLALAHNVPHIGKRLADKGIFTGYIGKWHLDGGDYFGLGVAPEGWDADTWYDMRNYLDELTEEERVKSRQTATMYNESLDSSFTYAHRCADRAVEFIRKNADKDYLLVVSFDEPHGPSLCPQPYAAMYLDYEMPKRPNVYDTLEDKPEHQKVWSDKGRLLARDALQLKAPALFGCNSYVDSQIGRVVAALDEMEQPPVVLYTSDHGDMLESHSLLSKGPAGYEEICHIPFILRGFGKGEVNTPVSHIDVASTIWDYFDLGKQPMMLQGESLLPMTHGENADRRDVFIEFGRYEVDHDGFGAFQPMRCIFDGRYKLVINLLSSDELYDLQQDPYEMKNLIEAPELIEVRTALHRRLLDHMNDIRDPFRGYYWENRPWNKDAAEPDWEYTGFTRQREELDYEVPQLDYATGLVPETLVRGKRGAKRD